MNQHPEIIAAPYTVWTAPVGTAFPAIDAAPGEAWTLLGSNGDRSYSGGGVTVAQARQYASSTPAAATGSSTSWIEGDGIRVRVELLDLTLEQYAVVLGQNAVAVTPAAPGIAGVKTIGLAVRTGRAAEFAVLARGPSPYADGMAAQYELPRCTEVGNPQAVFRKGVPAGLAVELMALEDPLATSEETRFGRLVAQFEAAQEFPPLRLFGTGLRLPTSSLTKSGNNHTAGDFAVGMPDHEVDEIYFFFATFFANTVAEVDCPNGYTIEGLATRDSGGQRTPGLIDDGTDPVVINPALPAMAHGKWVKFNPAAPIPGGITQVFAAAQFIPDGTYPRSRGGTVASTSIWGGTTKDERGQQSNSSLLSTLSGSANYNNSGTIVMPAAAMCRTPAGTLAHLTVGDSIGYGAHQTANAALWTERHTWGFMEMGLDDNVSSRRIQGLILAIPSWGHESTGTTKSQSDVTACSRQLWMMAKAREINGGRPLADVIFSEHGTNTSGRTTDDYRLLAEVWRGAVGTPETPFYQAEMLPRPVSSTDGFATVENQTVAADDAYPSGSRWTINAATGGPDGLGDPMAELRADGTIQGSFAPWQISAVDLTTNRDKLAPRPLNGVLTSAYSGSGPILMDISPPIGDYLSMVGGGNTAAFIVLSVSGTGPYSVTGTFFTGSGIAFSSGAAIRSMWHDFVGLHPGPFAHRAYALESLVPFKVALGWTAPLTAPAFTSSSITGTAEDGQVLTANATVTGNPAPTLAYQWQRNGTNISGQTAQTITLNESGMGLLDGDTISCEITANNSEGSANAEPPRTFTGSATSLYGTGDIALLAGTAEGDEIIDIDSFRLCRESPLATLDLGITDGGVNGAKRIRFNHAAYDGAASGITVIRVQVLDGTTLVQDLTGAGSVDFTHTFANGTIRFRANTTGRGGRIDGLLITAA